MRGINDTERNAIDICSSNTASCPGDVSFDFTKVVA